MSKSFIIVEDERHIKRKSYKALGSLVKILTEIITNSDDSYRRLKGDSAIDHSCLIKICINKTTKEVSIVDYAEGMSSEEIKRNFERYGADKSGRGKGYKTRGLFGQGATDVLFTQKNGKIISFKEGEVTEANFRWVDDGKREVSLKDLKGQEESLRKKYDISKNGTIVSFVLDPKITIPQKIKKLATEISQFYMLRLMMEDKTRNILLFVEENNKINLPQRLYYEFPTFEDQNIIYQGLISFEFEDSEIKGCLKLIRVEDKLEKEKDHGELKILVFDNEKNVYDNTFFRVGDMYPGVGKINGYLELYNTAEIIREKLNLERPEEILTDSRDGFNKNHDFYKKLNNVVYPIIEKYANELNVSSEGKISSDDFKSQKKLFNELNRYLKDELEGIKDLGGNFFEKKPPIDGFDFARDRIKITLGKKYSLKIIVNNKIFNRNYKISLDNSNDDCVSLSPREIKINDLSDGGVSYFNVYLEGKEVTKEDCIIRAYNQETNTQKKIFVSVVPQTIHYPKNPIEFYPNYLNAKIGNNSKLKLYIDTKIIDLKSNIILISTNRKIKILQEKLKIEKSNIMYDDIAIVDVIVGCDRKESGKIIASCNNYMSKAEIVFSDKEIDLKRGSGFLRGWDFTDNPETFWQKYLHPKTGKININKAHFINRQYFGENPTNKSITKNKLSQKYLAEVLSDELARYTTKEMCLAGKIILDPDAIFEEHQRQKNKLAGIIYKFKID